MLNFKKIPDRLFFHYSQVLGTTTDLRVQDEVEFEIVVDRDNRKVATRISRLKKGTINFESFSPDRVNGEVASPPQVRKSIFYTYE